MRSVGNRIAYMISDVNMNNGHPGLTKIAKTTLRLDVEQLKVGELVIFINRAFTAFKLYAANNVVCHYRHPKGYLLNYDAMRLVPQFFDGVDTGTSRRLPRRSLTAMGMKWKPRRGQLGVARSPARLPT